MSGYFKKWNTLRNQLLIVYLMAILIVLVIVSSITYILVKDLLENNAEEQIRKTAVESSGRYDSLFEQLNMVTKQVITNPDIQHVLHKEANGQVSSFNERQALVNITHHIQANADGIYSLEIYNRNNQRLIPIDSTTLTERINPYWIKKAEEAGGKLTWIGEDPLDANYYLVIRQLNLMDRAFERGGYVIARINRDHFQINPAKEEQETKNYTILLDARNQPIASNYPENKIILQDKEQLLIDEKEYMAVENTSALTGWSLYILTPVQELTKGISTVQAGIFIAGIIGLVIFFVISYFISTFITKPITKLTKTMREAGKGVLAQNPVVNTSNELNELNQTYNQLAEETNYLIQMVYEKEIIKNRTELKALQAQIHPHFLFNTLDALYWSLDEKEEEELAEAVLAMSELFRYTVTKQGEEEWVTLQEELDHILRYMKIMRMRFGERLLWDKEVEEECLHVKIPKLMIQPLVENAILHGAGNKIGNTHIKVRIEKVTSQNRLRVMVTDDGPGMSKEQLDEVCRKMRSSLSQQGRQGMALYNVRKRLNMYYKSEETEDIQITSSKGKGTTVSFEIPF